MGSSPPPSLRQLRLKPEHCGPAELFVQWRDALGEVFEVRATPAEIAAFRGEIDVHASARYVASSSRNSPLSLVRRSASAAEGRIAICLQINGSAAGLAGDRPIRADPGDVMFVDLSQSLTMRQSAPDGLVDVVTLWTVRDRILPLVSDENALHGLIVRAETPAGAVIGATMRAFAGSASKMRLTDFDAVAEGLVTLATKSIGPALARVGDAVVPPPLASFVTVRRYIDRKLASPDLNANSIAAEFGLSRASLLQAIRTGRRHRQIYPQGEAKPRLSGDYRGRILQSPDWIYRLSARVQECERFQSVVSRGLRRHAGGGPRARAADGR
jgi:AraC-binding-like domain